jgi:hypothetical protein
MRWCRDAGYPWFPEVLMVIGRRGGKGHLGAVCTARVIWELMLMVDPQAELGIMAGKRLTIPVFAGQADQARSNQFRDIAEILDRAPCFKQLIARRLASRYLLWTPQQVLDGDNVNPEHALIEIVAREATPLAARGPATPMFLYDEMAFAVDAGANRSAAEVLNAAAPAMAQFPAPMLYQASSPWDQIGQFYESYCEALALDPVGTSLNPDVLVVQLPSWEMYENWELTHDPGFLTYPGGPPFPKIDAPYLTRESPILVRWERRDPVRFATEYGAQWARVQNPFLDERHVKRIFAGLPNRPLDMQPRGALGHEHYAHIDLSRRRANTALMIGHPEDIDGLRHFIVDHIKLWSPRDYPNGEIDQYALADELLEYVSDFRLVEITTDSYDAPLITQYLDGLIAKQQLSWRPRLEEHPASLTRNRREAELFREAIALDRVHAPEHEHARRELLFLEQGRDGKVGPPTTGLVRTSDVADCFFALTARLLDGHLDVFEKLSATTTRFGWPGGIPTAGDQAVCDQLGGLGRRVNWHAEEPQRAQRPRRQGPRPYRSDPSQGFGFQ